MPCHFRYSNDGRRSGIVRAALTRSKTVGVLSTAFTYGSKTSRTGESLWMSATSPFRSCSVTRSTVGRVFSSGETTTCARSDVTRSVAVARYVGPLDHTPRMTVMKPPRNTCRMNFRRRCRTATISRHGIWFSFIAMSSERGDGQVVDRQRIAEVLLHEEVDVGDLRARHEDHVQGPERDVGLRTLAGLDQTDVDRPAERFTVRTLADQDDLAALGGVEESARRLDRLVERHAPDQRHDALLPDFAVHVDVVAARRTHDDAHVRVGELAGVALGQFGIELHRAQARGLHVVD